MHFALRQQGPAQVCGTMCKTYIVASGAITADTPTEFRNFAKNLSLKGALVVLESEGGSVHGAMALMTLMPNYFHVARLARPIRTSPWIL